MPMLVFSPVHQPKHNPKHKPKHQPKHKPNLLFIVHTIFFLISTCEESSLPMKHAKNYHVDFSDCEGHNP
jgi:hypothetical protein